ncbi:MAG: Asp23/Gls24 family envelope stress response protein [Lachnospiraceae bacterium]|nr:Asp23/Gls24 family envelope stress response protein [Lachnospiraceae bacterium]
MGKETEVRSSRIISHDTGNIGEVRIADEVIAGIAALAATEIKGVSAMSGNITKDLISKLGMGKVSNGVTLQIEENNVRVDLALYMEYGYSVPKVCRKVQEKVKAAVENMTGMNVTEVNVRIAGVNIDKSKA